MEKTNQLSQSKQEILQQLLKGKKSNLQDKIKKRTSSNPAHLSYAQRRLWFLEQLVPNSSMYNMPAVMRLEGELNLDALEYSLKQIIDRHEVLRTNFIVQENGQPVQVINKDMKTELIKVSLSHLSLEEQQAEANRLIEIEAKNPFDLSSDLLVRAKLLTLSEEKYLLIVVMHHIVSDGWSFGVFAKEFMYFYTQFITGENQPIELPVQYADFAEWQIEKFENNEYKKQLDYWEGILHGELPILQMPTNRTKQFISSFEGARYSFQLEKELLEQLKNMAREAGCTLYMLLLAAYNVLLYRYTEQEDIIVGTPIANRQHRDIEGLIGFFANSLAIRTDLSHNPTFKDLLTRVQKATIGAFSNQDVPFEVLVEKVQPNREANQKPIFQTMFVLQNTPNEKLFLPGLSLEFLDVHNGTAKFDLLLSTMESDQGLIAAFEYSTELFEEELIKNMAAHFTNILMQVMIKPDQNINQIEFLTKSEQMELFVNSSAQAVNKEELESLTSSFERIVQKYPYRIAVSYDDQTMTYTELNNRANQLARYLKKHGVNRGDFVGICMERSTDMMIGMLSILKCGAAYLPLDPHYPADRLSFMIEDSGVKTVISSGPSSQVISIGSLNYVNIDRLWNEIMNEEAHNLEEKVTSQDLAYILYTSGSTGLPKGVLVDHANVVRLFTSTLELYQFNERDVWTLFHSYAFDFSVWEIWGAFLFGGQLVIVPYQTSRSPEEFLELLVEKKVTVLNQTPSAYKQLLQVQAVYSEEIKEKIQLRYIIFGGEALDLQTLKPWFDAYGDQKPCLVNMYGITETTVHVTYRSLNMQDVIENKGSLIGNPINDLYAYILDKNLQPVPTGVPGELYVGGGGVSRGYWNRDDITDERFILDPIQPSAQKVYRTGDLVKRTFLGELEYLGRIDNQVKIRGFRIELGEIEALLNKKPEIKESIVSVYSHNDDKRLVSYLLLDSDYIKSTLELLELNEQQVNEWEEVFDDYYDQGAASKDPTFNIVGWNSTYTNEAIPAEEMKVWLEDTVDKILGLNPKKVLEIGVGTGMILYRVAPHCEKYTGTDLSANAIRYTGRQLTALEGNFSHVQLLQQAAHQLDQIENHSVDTVILNSIIQYFPSKEYLTEVIGQALNKLESTGTIFIGDVRHFELLKLFYLSLELHQSPGSKTAEEIRNHITSRLMQESELVLSPEYFRELQTRYPQISNIQFTAKRGIKDNELTKFRYDVVLSVGEGVKHQQQALSNSLDELHWESEKLTLEELKEYVTSKEKEAVLVSNITNSRLEEEVKALQLLQRIPPEGTLLTLQDSLGPLEGIHPEELWRLADDIGYKVQLSINQWSGLTVSYNAIFYKGTKEPSLFLDRLAPFEIRSKQENATSPLKVKLAHLVTSDMRSYLESRLPSFMVPSDFMIIEKIPLTSNGKADIKALPKPFAGYAAAKEKYQSPTTAVQKELAEVWKKTLGLNQIDVNDNFFEVGGHSLLATQLIFAVREKYRIHLPLRLLFEKPTIADMASVIEEFLKGEQHESEVNLFNKNLNDEVYLDPEIKASKPYQAHDVQSILLTGVTGFFGSFLLHELLIKTESKIYCLVRATSHQQAMERIRKNLKKYHLLDESALYRIIPVVGNLAQPYLGLCSTKFLELAETIDSIIHNGAHVNFIYPYETLKDSNVNGTREIIRLAGLSKVKPIHFVSTLYVYPPSKNEEEIKYINENDPLESSEGLRMGYTQTKWAAEKILDIARERGIPVNIYRLGRISGHSQTGACQTNDFFWSMIKGCIEIKKYPNENIMFEMSPVDYLSNAFVQLFMGQKLNRNFHLFNKNNFDLNLVTAAIAKLGYELLEVTYEEWLQDLTTEDNAARPLAQLIQDGIFQGSRLVFDNQNVVEEIKEYNSLFIREEMIQAIMTYFVQTGYLEAPVALLRGEK